MPLTRDSSKGAAHNRNSVHKETLLSIWLTVDDVVYCDMFRWMHHKHLSHHWAKRKNTKQLCLILPSFQSSLLHTWPYERTPLVQSSYEWRSYSITISGRRLEPLPFAFYAECSNQSATELLTFDDVVDGFLDDSLRLGVQGTGKEDRNTVNQQINTQYILSSSRRNLPTACAEMSLN